jgi:hypothetical protein
VPVVVFQVLVAPLASGTSAKPRVMTKEWMTGSQFERMGFAFTEQIMQVFFRRVASREFVRPAFKGR